MTAEDYVPGNSKAHPHSAAGRSALVLGALGVVFGDLGTSPIYTVQTVFSPDDPHRVYVNRDTIFGIASMIFWSVMIIVTVTYVLLIMRADNDGEGGIMALITLVRRGGTVGARRTKLALAVLGIFGASLFLGDSMITPAISVLSAVEGAQVAAPSIGHLVIPITAVIIVALFLFQHAGTATVGRLFGPVMLLWFVVIGACGIGGIAGHPGILAALSPTYAASFFVNHFGIGFFALAAVVLAVTGAEALYADLGHFGRAPITIGWLLIVFPACALSYLGQAAKILYGPAGTVSNPFFLLAPSWGRWPLVVLATAATVIASQAVITGAFSLTHQAVQLGYLPQLRIKHTSRQAIGQVYVPWINWLLMVSVLTLVFTFKTSEALAFAFGMAVTGTITISTVLFLYIARRQWQTPRWIVIGGGGALVTVDLFFFAANTTKIVHGAWLPLVIALTVFTVLVTWQRGRALVTERRERLEGPLQPLVDDLQARRPPLLRTPGTGVFLSRNKLTVPLAMRNSIDYLHVLPAHVVILTIETLPVPHVPDSERIVVHDLRYRDDCISQASARFGYMDKPNVPMTLALLEHGDIEAPIDAETASYFLSTIELKLGDAPGMSRWRKVLFLATSQLASDPADYFHLPRERTVVMGSRIEV
jgi:KUP system potassium uptake protein